MPNQVSPQAILPRSTRPFADADIFTSEFKQFYTAGNPLAGNFIDLPNTPCRRVIVRNNTGVSLEFKRSTHDNSNLTDKNTVIVLNNAFDSFDVISNANELSVRRGGAVGNEAPVLVYIECCI